MPDKTFLITTPEHDDVLYYCSIWSGEIIDLAEKKGFKVIHLPKDKANRKNFEGRTKKNKPNFIMFNGHGNPDNMLGHDDKVLLQMNNNETLMKDKIIYARSCFSLSKLGKSCSSKGTKAFIGYYLPFMFVSDPNRSANPLKDKLASPCFTSSNMIPLSLIKGNSAKEATDKCREQMDKLIEFWKTQNIVEAPTIVACLMWNKKGLGIEGNKNAQL